MEPRGAERLTMSYDGLPDEQLVALVTHGAPQALGALYDRHGRAVYGLALHLLRDPARAEEMTQEVFLNLWLRAATYRPDRGSFHTWLMTVCHHRVVDELRRHRRQENALAEAERDPVIHSVTPFGSPEEGAQQSEEGAAVRRALNTLPAEQSQVVELAYYHGLTQSEIAARLRQPLGTVKTRMRLAMQKLRAALAIYQESP